MRVCRRGCLRVATIGFLLLMFAVQEPSALADAPDEPQAEQETVVLLHGLGRSWRSMKPLESRLSAEGYKVHNFSRIRHATRVPLNWWLELERQLEDLLR